MTYQISQAASFLYGIGVSFHADGVLSRDGVKLFDYYKADKITQEQRDKILAWCPLAEFKTASPEYAPEMKSVLVCFPKAAYFRQRKALLQEQAKEQARLEFSA